ncbi:hypothetical protein R6Q57_015315 [Mikania cordata]
MQGDGIEAVIDVDPKNYYEPDIEVLSCYKVTKYVVVENRNFRPILKHQASIKLGKKAYVEPFSDEHIPHYFFQFASYDELNDRMSPPQLLTVEKNFERFTPTAKQLRKLDLRDARLKDVTVQAIQSVTKDTVTMRHILDQLSTGKKSVFKCVAHIKEIQSYRKWFYATCSVCNNKLYKEVGETSYYVCTNDEQMEPKFMYCVNASITDETTTTNVVFFNQVMTELLGTTCQDMVVIQGYDDPKVPPPQMIAKVGRQMTFELTVIADRSIRIDKATEALETSSSKSLTPPTEKVDLIFFADTFLSTMKAEDLLGETSSNPVTPSHRPSSSAIMFMNAMMLTTGTTVVHRSYRPTTPCFASRVDADQLRDQLEQIQFEALNTRAKANKARQRLLRLSESAEKLKRQAAKCVQAGKDNDARDLLFQKKKIMQALDNTKNRIELLDELSAKLIEAISLGERQLVETVSLDLEIEKEDTESPIRLMSPSSENLEIDENFEKDFLNTNDDQEPQERTNELSTEHETKNLEEFLQVHHDIDNNDDLISSLNGLTSYVDFLDRVDEHLKKVESEVVTVVKFSNLILESEEKPTNLKVQRLKEILDAVQHIRRRIAVIMQTEAEMK